MTMRNFADQPRAAWRPAILVEVPVSSMNTQPVGIELGLIVRPCRSRRCNARPILLGRSDAFFEADAVAVEEPPDRLEPRLLLTLIEQTTLDLFQRQIGFLPNQLEQPVFMFLQWRSALALEPGLKTPGFPPALHPADRGRIPNHKLPRRRPCHHASLYNSDHSNS